MTPELTNRNLLNFFATRSMQSLTTVDLGNSHPHCAQFMQGKIAHLYELEALSQLENIEDPVVISSVTKTLETGFKTLWKDDSFCSMKVHYNKNQLGVDRLYQAAFLYHAMPDLDLILIDAGTFITVDHINQAGFQGGHIYPGLQTFINSYSKGERLPSLDEEKILQEQKNLPRTTSDAISGAVYNYVSSLCDSLKKQYPQKTIILTGGSAKFFKDHLSKAQTIDHLIHYALYFLYQEEQK